MGMAIIRPDIHSLNCHGLRGSVMGKASGWLLMLDFRRTTLLLFSVSFLDGGFLVAARRGVLSNYFQPPYFDANYCFYSINNTTFAKPIVKTYSN